MEKMKNSFKKKGYGLYIHIPFCAKKCNYCAFNVSIVNSIPEKRYLSKLITELKFYHKKEWKTVYIGGGTPNLLSNDFYLELFKHIDILKTEEITIELNPEFVTKKQIEFYKLLGINRFSLGIQTFNENGLNIMGRNHDNNMAFKALEILKDENYSFDLIYGYPAQTLNNLLFDLKKIKEISPKHLSIYNLSYEEGAFFYKWKNSGKIKPLKEELEVEMYDLINEKMGEIGLKRYEISNFSKESYESKHNMLYWTSYPYIGIGVGAHSYYFEEGNIIRSEKEKKLKNYLKFDIGHLEKKNILSKKEYVFDRFYSEMRKLYIDLDDFLLHTDIDLLNIIKSSSKYKLIKNLIDFKNNQIVFTDLGIINSNSVFDVFYDIIESEL